jgi:MFS family permease
MLTKLPPKYSPLMFVGMSLFMSLVMSGVITAINTGLADVYLWRWSKAWAIAMPLAFVVGALFRPVAHKLVQLTVEREAGAK